MVNYIPLMHQYIYIYMYIGYKISIYKIFIFICLLQYIIYVL